MPRATARWYRQYQRATAFLVVPGIVSASRRLQISRGQKLGAEDDLPRPRTSSLKLSACCDRNCYGGDRRGSDCHQGSASADTCLGTICVRRFWSERRSVGPQLSSWGIKNFSWKLGSCIQYLGIADTNVQLRHRSIESIVCTATDQPGRRFSDEDTDGFHFS